MIKELFKNGVISAARLKTMQESSELKEIDRYTLCSMVKAITVFEDKRLEIEFYYMNQYCIMKGVNRKTRLSSDQDIKKNESVEVQIEIAKKFVEEFNGQKTGEVIDVVECYTDLGKTGSNFEREGFLRLLQDIRLGEINCVIVKDLSWFGRNYLEAGNYIEKIFPFLGVRSIAVADGFDTGKEGNENKQMASEIKNFVNDMYAKDFSKKAKLHLKQKREEGSYVGGPPPYGYKAEYSGKRRVLLPDENTKSIVKFIYERFVETESYTAVAEELNRRRINPPYLYKKTKEVYHAADEAHYKGWDKGAVERILKSETYIGTLVQGKTSIAAKNEKNRIYKPEDDWVVTKDAHEPLIGEELYKKAVETCQRIKKRTAAHKHPTKGYPIEENIFDNVLYCGVCGRKMTRSSYVKQYANQRKCGKDAHCNRIKGSSYDHIINCIKEEPEKIYTKYFWFIQTSTWAIKNCLC